MDSVKVVIPGKFGTLNDFIDKNRRGKGRWNSGNNMKQLDQQAISFYLPRVKFKKIFLEYHYFEPNARRDKDNVSGYFHKVFQDALVHKGIIENDGWRNVEGWTDIFSIDPKNPRIEIMIREVKNEPERKS